MRGWLLLVSGLLASMTSCASDDGKIAEPTGVGGNGGNSDASSDSPADGSSDQGSSCSDGSKSGDESDVDCGGSCPKCDANEHCNAGTDCNDGVCESGSCQSATCSDGVRNAGELSVDCGGLCPPTYHGFGCVSGTNGSQACSSFPGDAGTPTPDDAGTLKFQVAISWNATGGNGKVNYVLVYGANGIFNSQGLLGGSPLNTCTSGPVTENFELPLGDTYTYKIWWADCVNPNACAGCGSDVVIAEGGPFGIAADLCL